MNYLPMLSHQQLLYLLTMSFVSRSADIEINDLVCVAHETLFMKFMMILTKCLLTLMKWEPLA